jgi:CDP-diglyceride synthetase
MAAFLLGFAVLILFIAYYYLLPAMEAARSADASGRRQLSAFSTLLLAIVLFSLLVGLAMTFRIHRFFFPRPLPKRTQTEYIDAWQESARRYDLAADEQIDEVPDDDEDDGRERV